MRGPAAALYGAANEVLGGSNVIGTGDTGVKVLDEKLPFARGSDLALFAATKSIR